MTRISRSVAQRYATKKRRRKDSPRVPSRLAQSMPAAELEATSSSASGPSIGTAQPTAQTVRPSTVRRAANYSQQYHYVWGDIRRIVIVSAVLLVALIILSYVIK